MVYSYQKDEGISRGKFVSESKIKDSEQIYMMWDCKMILGLTNPHCNQFNHKTAVSPLLRCCAVGITSAQAPEYFRSPTDFQ